jgi:hypothetical protein
LRGVADNIKPEQMASHFGKQVVLSGTAVYRPSGALLRIEADHLGAASDVDLDLWSSEPKPLETEMDVHSLRRPQGPRSGINAIFGQWPGDETEEQLLADLEEIS